MFSSVLPGFVVSDSSLFEIPSPSESSSPSLVPLPSVSFLFGSKPASFSSASLTPSLSTSLLFASSSPSFLPSPSVSGLNGLVPLSFSSLLSTPSPSSSLLPSVISGLPSPLRSVVVLRLGSDSSLLVKPSSSVSLSPSGVPFVFGFFGSVPASFSSALLTPSPSISVSISSRIPSPSWSGKTLLGSSSFTNGSVPFLTSVLLSTPSPSESSSPSFTPSPLVSGLCGSKPLISSPSLFSGSFFSTSSGKPSLSSSGSTSSVKPSAS